MTEIETKNGDILVYGLAANETVRCMAAITTNTIAEAATRHKTSATATAALGRTMTGALLLGASLKELDRLTVQIIGDGPIGGISAESNAKGEVRGYVRNPNAESPFNEKGKLDVRGIVGNGMFYVMREAGFEIGFRPEPYQGSVPIVSGEIAEDFAYYLTTSEQIPSGVLLGVHVRGDKDSGGMIVTAAGGVMIQMMPGADEKTIGEIEHAITNTTQSVTDMIHNGASAEYLIRAALGTIEFSILEKRNVRFTCQCSHERAVSMVGALDTAEIQSMLSEDKGAVITCHFCNETYIIDEAMLGKVFRERSSI